MAGRAVVRLNEVASNFFSAPRTPCHAFRMPRQMIRSAYDGLPRILADTRAPRILSVCPFQLSWTLTRNLIPMHRAGALQRFQNHQPKVPAKPRLCCSRMTTICCLILGMQQMSLGPVWMEAQYPPSNTIPISISGTSRRAVVSPTMELEARVGFHPSPSKLEYADLKAV